MQDFQNRSRAIRHLRCSPKRQALFEQADGKISFKLKDTCTLSCSAGYTKTGGTIACTPNNPDGAKTEDKEGKIEKQTLTCVGTCMSIVAEGALVIVLGREREPSVLSTHRTVAHTLTA